MTEKSATQAKKRSKSPINLKIKTSALNPKLSQTQKPSRHKPVKVLD